MPSSEAGLLAQLEQSRALGFLGPGPVEDHLRHARDLLAICDRAGAPDGAWLDLGSGGGLPGLVCAVDRPDRALVLLDASERRCQFLRDACLALGRTDVVVLHGRAEDWANVPEWSGHFSLVVARSFGRPAVTAECAVGFLRLAGILVVSDRVDDFDARWPDDGLAQLGLAPAHREIEGGTTAVVVTHQSLIGGFPRRNGVPTKRPLW